MIVGLTCVLGERATPSATAAADGPECPGEWQWRGV